MCGLKHGSFATVTLFTYLPISDQRFDFFQVSSPRFWQ